MDDKDGLEHIRLKVIPRPAEGTRTVFVVPNTSAVRTMFRGEAKSGISFDCGNCGVPLMQDVLLGQVGDLVLKCGACSAYNEVNRRQEHDPEPPHSY